MKSPVKALILAAALGVGLPLVAWTGTFLYWHLRIASAVNRWERDTDVARFVQSRAYGLSQADADTLRAAGCRALPYLVDSLRPSRTLEFRQDVVRYVLHFQAALGPPEESTDEDFHRKMREWTISSADSPTQRETKCAQILEWWHRSGHQYHQWWRVWSPNCRGAR